MNDQRKTKKQLAEEVSRLGERLDLFQGLVENSPDAITKHDAQGRVNYFSPGAEALTGYTAEEVSNMRAADFFPGGVEQAREVMRLLQADGQLRNYQQAIVAKDGRLIEIITSISLLRDTEGEISGTIGVWKDITEQKRAEEALRKSEERSDALYRVSNLLAGAHDTDEVLDLIVNESARLLALPFAFIRLLAGEELVASAATEVTVDFLVELGPSIVIGEGTTPVGHVMATKKPLAFEDVLAVPEGGMVSPELRLALQKYGFRGVVIVPLLANDRPIGVLTLGDTKVRPFTVDEVSLLTAFADQAALALEKARLLNEAETERERAETERERSDALYRISNFLASAHDTDEVLDLIVNEAARLVGATGAFMRLLNEEVLVPSAATKSAAAFLAELGPLVLGEGGAGKVMATKQIVVTEDAANDERIAPENRRVAQSHGIRGGTIIPLLANDRSVGTLTVFDSHKHLFTDDEVSLLTAFADQAALALEKARLLNEAERERERADSLYQISNQLAGAHDTEEVLGLIVKEAGRLIGTDYVAIRLLEGDSLVPSAATGPMKDFWARSAETLGRFKVEEGASAAGHVMATKKPLYGEEVERLGTPEGLLVAQEHGFQTGSAILVPLLANDRSIGVLIVMDTRIRQVREDEVSLLAAFADQASLALEKARLLNEAETERERADSLYRISNLLAAAHDTDEVLDLIVNEAARLLGAPMTFIRLLNHDELVSSAATEAASTVVAALPSAQFVKERASVSAHVMATQKPLFGDAAAEKLAPAALLLFEEIGIDPGAACVVPLLANDQSIGTLTVMDSDHPGRRFTEDEVSLLAAFADQASLALEKARLLNEAEVRERQATQLYKVTTQLASNHDLTSLLDLITQQATELTGGRGSLILRYDESRGGLVVTTMHNLNPESREMFVRPGEGNSGRAYVERRTVWTNDSLGDSAVVYSNADTERLVRAQATDWGTLGVVAAPIMIQDEVYGILVVAFDKHIEFSDEDINLMQNLADSAAVAINNARFIEETQHARDEATQLYEITEQLASTTDMDSVLDLITAKATEMLKSLGSSILRFDEGSDSLVHAKSHNVPPALVEQYAGRSGEGVSGLAFQESRPAWSSDISTDQNLTQTEGATRRAIDRAGLRGVLAVPVIVRDQPYGVLNVIYQETHEFTDADIRLLQTLADSASVAIGNARFIEEIQQRTAELDATNQELEAFSYSVSHDLRAPLRGIDGFSQALLNEYSDVLDEQAQHYLERVRTGSERMGQLIDDLLALSQVTRGEMRRENVDLSDLSRTIVTGLQERDPQRQVEFVIQDGVVLNGDTRLLRVALENLLGNAWKYTGKKQEARIEFGLTEDDGKRTCFVRDDGFGFDMAYADRLFGAFQRLHDASEFEGSGIGLATVQRIINRHGGQIWAESAPDQGATFYFTLH